MRNATLTIHISCGNEIVTSILTSYPVDKFCEIYATNTTMTMRKQVLHLFEAGI